MVQWIVPLAFVIGGLLAGLICERTILVRLRKLAIRTQRKINEIIIKSLQGMTFIWFAIAGIYTAILSLTIAPNIAGIIQKLLIIIFLYSVTVFLASLSVGFVTLYGQKAFLSASLLSNLTRIIIYVFGILIILQTIGLKLLQF